LFLQLATGRQQLAAIHSDQEVYVHLSLRGIPTTIGSVESLSPDFRTESFQKFLLEGWRGDNDGNPILPSSSDWAEVNRIIQNVCKLNLAEFEAFRRHCHLDFEPKVETASHSKDDVERGRGNDIEKLKAYLLNLASADQRPDLIPRERLLRDLSWENRFRAAYPHEFRVDPRYQPIQETVETIRSMIARCHRGYIALIGSPGSGKSTALTHTLRQLRNCRLVRYYAFIPDDTLLSRGEAQSFLHDVVIQLQQQGIRGRGVLARKPWPTCKMSFPRNSKNLDRDGATNERRR